jgi:hypothetical protein
MWNPPPQRSSEIENLVLGPGNWEFRTAVEIYNILIIFGLLVGAEIA